MGKAARLKRDRRAARTPPPVGKQRPLARRTKLVWAATAAALVGVMAVVVALAATRSSATAPPPAARASADDLHASTSLVEAARKIGFTPNVEPGVGELEGRPAAAAHSASNPDLLPVGAKAPSFTLKTPEGQTFKLGHLRRKAVLVEFFATWCPHCDAEAPHLRGLYSALPKNKVAFVSINADGENPASVYAYHRYFGLPFPALLDPSPQPGDFHQPGAAGVVTTRYRVRSYPTFYVLDPNGRISWRSDGEQPDALLRQRLLQAANGA